MAEWFGGQHSRVVIGASQSAEGRSTVVRVQVRRALAWQVSSFHRYGPWSPTLHLITLNHHLGVSHAELLLNYIYLTSTRYTSKVHCQQNELVV